MTIYKRVATVGLAIAVAALAAACGKSVTSPPATTAAPPPGSTAVTPTGPAGVPTDAATIMTPTPSGVAGNVVWGVYRETNSLDPLIAFDYPENTAIAALCDAVLRQAPDGTIGPGLATAATFTDPTTLVLDLRTDARFWDGTTLTSADVVFSLKRQADPKAGGFYSGAFVNVSSIVATGPSQVTIKLSKPDVWLRGELAGTAGFIVEERYATTKGKDFGTVKGGTMCTGAYKLDGWKTGEGVSMVPNTAYWDTALVPKVTRLTIKGIPDDAAITSGLETGELNGVYGIQLSTLDQLASSGKVNVYKGPSYGIDAFIVSSFKGALGDVRVRQALSMAIDRPGLVQATYKGAGFPARALGNPGTWSYGKDVFTAAWNALPDATTNIDAAKALITAAGATGKTIRLGMSSELPALATESAAFKSAAESIGLKAELVSTSAANYINFFIDAKARDGIDGFFTANYPDYADPAALFATLAMKGGSQNFSGYENAQVTDLLTQARGEQDDAKRAQLVADAQKIIMNDLPWIAVVAPETALVMTKDITGPPATFNYMFGPWAAYLGKA